MTDRYHGMNSSTMDSQSSPPLLHLHVPPSSNSAPSLWPAPRPVPQQMLPVSYQKRPRRSLPLPPNWPWASAPSDWFCSALIKVTAPLCSDPPMMASLNWSKRSISRSGQRPSILWCPEPLFLGGFLLSPFLPPLQPLASCCCFKYGRQPGVARFKDTFTFFSFLF